MATRSRWRVVSRTERQRDGGAANFALIGPCYSPVNALWLLLSDPCGAEDSSFDRGRISTFMLKLKDYSASYHPGAIDLFSAVVVRRCDSVLVQQ